MITKEQFDKIVELLRWYADDHNYIGKDLYSNPNQDFPYATEPSPVQSDWGKKAKDLLKELGIKEK
jgi:hypothetical protein